MQVRVVHRPFVHTWPGALSHLQQNPTQASIYPTDLRRPDSGKGGGCQAKDSQRVSLEEYNPGLSR